MRRRERGDEGDMREVRKFTSCSSSGQRKLKVAEMNPLVAPVQRDEERDHWREGDERGQQGQGEAGKTTLPH